ncbi:hypothetical protein MKX01_003563 [Papaver californicum]|nr:hypothetical protein MKX01_003563 [Papaver californicum]
MFINPANHLRKLDVNDCFCEKTWSHTPHYKIGYCQQCPDKVKWPAEMGAPPSLYFNAGMFLFEPNLCTYHNLLRQLKISPTTPFAEDTYKPIPLVYNLVLSMLWRHPENVELDKVKVVHYCAAGSKPWRYTGEEENMQREDIKMLVKKWWDIYNDESLDYKMPLKKEGEIDKPNGTVESGNFQLFLSVLSDAGVKFIKAPSAA